MDFVDGNTATIERAEELEKDPKGIVKRWLLELKLADKREDDWRKKSERVWNRYRQKEAKKHSFNILWSNTETLRPAIYNSLPQPDVRRRFKDADPMGKACSEVLKRSLEYGLDTEDFDANIKATVLDMLLPGRGIARVRYVPSFAQVGVTPETHDEENEQHEAGGEALEGHSEEVDWEQAPIEHVQWDDFRISIGKEWQEVCWIAFRHKLTRDELCEQFGDEVGNAVTLDAADDKLLENERDENVKDSFKTAEVWEIWDKDEQRVLFVSSGLKEKPLQVLPDPLNLQGFWPIPRPLYAVEDSSSLVPVPLYELYKEQAEELDKITVRINKIVDGMRLRGVYDSTLTELSELMRGQDNDFIPAENVTALLERGGLDKAIWTTGTLVQNAAMVLKELFVQREQVKQVIYEITGVSDILRGATNANETATAQQIKNQWGTTRLKRMQSEVSRFIRDLMRLQAEIIAEKFSPETLQTMTGLKFPMLAEKQQAMMQYQQAAAMAQQQGQQPPPPPPDQPAWEEVIQVLRDDKQRTFKVDVETDSTVAASLEADMQSLQQVTQAIGVVMKEMMPLVQGQVIPLDAAKELLMTISRRSKFGNAFEDALDKMQQPPPPPQEQQQPDHSVEVEQLKQQGQAQLKQAEMQSEQALESARMQHEERLKAIETQSGAMVEQAKMEADADLKWRIAQLDAETKVIVATIAAQQKAQSDALSAQQAAQQSAMEQEDKAVERETQAQEKAEGAEKYGQMQETINSALQSFQAAIERLSQPRPVVSGSDGRIAGIK